MMIFRQSHLNAALIFLLALVVFVPFLGGIPLFDWDEVNFAEAAREMLLAGDYARVYIDFLPFWEKPPLFFWMQALSMQLWGIGDFAARFPNALCGAFTLSAVYLIGTKLYDHRFGALWALAFGGSFLPHLYFHSGIIDPWFNLFIFLSVALLAMHSVTLRRIRGLLLAGTLLGLAVLAKGPVAYLIVALVVFIYWMHKKFRSKLALPHFLLYTIIALCTFGVWYGIEYFRNGSWFITEFIRYQIELLIKPGAGHTGFAGYHLVVLFFGVFPASIFALRPLFRRYEGNTMQKEFRLWMVLLLCVVLFLFSIVQSKIVHYSSLCYFPITFLGTVYLRELMNSGYDIGRVQKALIACVGFIYIALGVLLVCLGNHPDLIHRIMSLDINTVASLSLDIDWEWWRIAPVIFLAGGLVAFFAKIPVMRKVVILYLCTGAFVYAGVMCWIGKIQQYTQGPSTEFFASLAGEDVYAVTWGHKSFSPYWDFRKPLPDGFSADFRLASDTPYAKYSDAEFLLTSPDLDKDVYVLTKAGKAAQFAERFPDAERIGEKGGFVFFRKAVR